MNLKRWTVSSLFQRVSFHPLYKGVVLMVTYSDLFLFGTLIIGVITLVYNITKKK